MSRLNSVDFVIYNGGESNPCYQMQLVAEEWINLAHPDQRMPLDAFAGKEIHAMAGIGHPQRFFEQLREQGLSVIEHAFPDHHRFIADDIVFADRLPVLMTEKDAVKCAQLQTDREPERALDDCWYVPAKARLSSRLGPHLVELIRQRR
jgi:tetraacyldisaccharide 4'-kinase